MSRLRRRIDTLKAAVGPPDDASIRVTEATRRAVVRLGEEDRELAELIAADEITVARWRTLPRHERTDAVWYRMFGPNSPSAARSRHPRWREAQDQFAEVRFEESARVVGERTGDLLLPALLDRLQSEREALRSGEKVLDLGSLDPDAYPRAYLITNRERANLEWIRGLKAAISARQEALQPISRHFPDDPPPAPTAEPITEEGEVKVRVVETVARLEERHLRHVAYSERYEQPTNEMRVASKS